MLPDGIQPVVVFLHKNLRSGDCLQGTEAVAQRKLIEHIFFKAAHEAAVRNGRKRQRRTLCQQASFGLRFGSVGQEYCQDGKCGKKAERQDQCQYLLEFFHGIPPSSLRTAANQNLK